MSKIMSHDRTKQMQAYNSTWVAGSSLWQSTFFPSEITTEATNITEASEKAYIYFTN